MPRQSRSRHAGQGLVEYALVLVIVVIMVVLVLFLVGEKMPVSAVLLLALA